jgi:hypothetical protein
MERPRVCAASLTVVPSLPSSSAVKKSLDLDAGLCYGGDSAITQSWILEPVGDILTSHNPLLEPANVGVCRFSQDIGCELAVMLVFEFLRTNARNGAENFFTRLFRTDIDPLAKGNTSRLVGNA